MSHARSKFYGILAAAALAASAPLASAQGFITSAADQDFHIGDGDTVASAITIQCNVGDILASFNIRIVIPAAVDMEWDTSLTTSGVGGFVITDSSNKVASTVSYYSVNGGMKGLFLDVTADFLGAQVILSGLQFRNFGSATSGNQFLGLSKDANTVTIEDLDDKTIQIAGNGTLLSAAVNQVFAVGDLATAISTITVTDSNPPGMWASTNVRITIPATVDMQWNTGDTSVVINFLSGTGAISSTCSYSGTQTLILNVTTILSANAQFTVSGLSFQNFNSVSGPAGLTMSVNGGTTIADTDNRTKQVIGNPSIASASQTFITGDPLTPNSQITITDSAGLASITTANPIRIRIPSAALDWNTADFTPAFGGGMSGRVGAVSYPDAQTLSIVVTSNFSAGGVLTIDNLGFTNFTAGASGVQLELDIDGVIGTVEDLDSGTKSVGSPTLLSGSSQTFAVGGPTTLISPMTISGGPVPVITTASDIRVRIPAGFNMDWDVLDTTATISIGGAGSAAVSATVSYPDADTLLLNVTGNFSANQTVTVSNLSFTNFTAPSLPNFLQLQINPAGTNPIADADNMNIVIGGFPTILSNNAQFFTVNDPLTPIAQITIQDAGGSPTITMGNDIRVHLPAGFPMIWNTADLTATLGGTAGPGGTNRVSTTVSYEDFGTTLVLDVTSNFLASETLTISNLGFMNFTASSGGTGVLTLEVDNLGNIAANDGELMGVGAPTISSGADQSFGMGDSPTPASPITVIDDSGVNRLLTASDFRIVIPAALNMTWNPAAVISYGGAAAGNVSTTVTYLGGNKIAVFDVSSDFTGAQDLIINGLQYTAFGAPPATSSLRLEVTAGTAADIDDKTLTVSDRPMITGARTLDLNGNGSIDAVEISYSKDIDGATASATTGSGFTVAGFNIAAAEENPAGVLTLHFLDNGTPNSGFTPTLQYDPISGNLLDLGGLEAVAYGPSPLDDGAGPRISGMTALDDDGDGRLNRVVLTFTEALNPGQEDVNDWMLIDADGTTNLLAGLTSAAFAIVGDTITITLSDLTGTSGTPRFRYQDDGFGGVLSDFAFPSNFVGIESNSNPPIVSAGPNLTYGPTLVALNGTITEVDHYPFSFGWTQQAGPAVTLLDAATLQPKFLATIPATYTFRLTVTDTFWTTIDDVDINIANVEPNADAGFDQTVVAGPGLATLDATRTIDVNGEWFGTGLSCFWTQTAGPLVGLAGAASPLPTFPTAGVNDTLEFEVVVTDGNLNTSSARTRVRVNAGGNAVPTAVAGSDQIGAVGVPVTLDGRFCIDPEGGALTYAWTPSLLLAGAGTATPTFTPGGPGVYTFELVVRDLGGALSAPDTVSIYVPVPGNAFPQGIATHTSPSTDVTIGDHLVLHSHLSIDPEGQTLGHSWAQVRGPRIQTHHTAVPHADYFPAVAGTVTFRLLVSDEAQQGVPVFKTLPIKRTFGAVLPDGATEIDISDDPDGDGRVLSSAVLPVDIAIVGYPPSVIGGWWVQTRGPAVEINGVTNDTPSFMPSIAGLYSFEVTVYDFDGVTATRELNVVVDTVANEVPTADAGVDRSGVAGEAIVLNGSASSDPGTDGDGVTGFASGLTASWGQVSGPPVHLSGSTTATPFFVSTAPGNYTFELIVGDGESQAAPDLVMVVIQAALAADDDDDDDCGMLGVEVLLVMGAIAAGRRLRRRSR